MKKILFFFVFICLGVSNVFSQYQIIIVSGNPDWPNPICSASPVTLGLDGYPGTTPSWYADGVFIGQSVTILVNPTHTTTYTSNFASQGRTINVIPLPSNAGAITGATTVYQGQNSVTYTVPTIPNATSYSWTLPSGATGTSTSNSITVDFGMSAYSGNISVKGINSCGEGLSSSMVVTVTTTNLFALWQQTNLNNYVVTSLATTASNIFAGTLLNGVYLSTNAGLTWNALTLGQGLTNFQVYSVFIKDTYVFVGTNYGIYRSSNNGTSWSLVNSGFFGSFALNGNRIFAGGGNIICYSDNDGSNWTNTGPTFTGGSGVQGLAVIDNRVFAGVGAYGVYLSTDNGATWALANTGLSEYARIHSVSASGSTIFVGTRSGFVFKSTNYGSTWTALNTGFPALSTHEVDGLYYNGTDLFAGTNAQDAVYYSFNNGSSGDIIINGLAGDALSVYSFAILNDTLFAGTGFGVWKFPLCDIKIPASAGTITGNATVCQSQNSVTYTVPTITNATSYFWSLPSGATGTSSTNSITVNYGTSAISGNISVNGNNGCGNGAVSSLAITVNPLPVAADIITGSTTVCQGQNSITYTVPTITNASSYVWTLPTGATGTSTSNSITVNYGTSATSGNISVKGNNSCGDGAISTLAITVNPLPVAAGTITGNTTVCQGQNSVTYTVPTITNATSYVWTLPIGATGTSTSNSITVNYGTSVTSGNISVKGNNSCGDGAISTLAITVNPLPVTAGTITGSTTVCQGQNSVTYTVPTITNATSYIWALPSGATGTSTTNSITVNYGASATSGNITVKGNNSCGDGAISTLAITVNPLPVAAGTITGSTSVCQGQNSVTYTVPTITNATSYVWTLPTGATGTSTTNSITVNYGISATSGNISVKGNNSCGDGATSTLAITVNLLPVAAGTITGNAAVCQGQNSVTYTVPTITNATSYVWTLPIGATGTSTTNSITVNYETSASSGNITVKGNNSCGDGTTSTLAITVVPAPPANAGNDTIICPGSTITLIASGGNSYTWNNNVSQGVHFTPISTNTYTVTVSNGFCTAIDSIIVTISTPPTAPVIYQVGNDLHSTATTGNQWYNENGIISGASSQIYTPTTTSHYFVILSDTLGCISDTSNILYVVLTGLADFSNNNSIHIFPNPFSNELIIEIDGNKVNLNFEILNTIGQVVFKGNLINKTTVQTSTFAPGVYLIKLENGKTFEFKKIIKE